MKAEEAMEPQARRIGEVVEAASTEFVAQCYQLYEAPPLGALVRAGSDSPIYAIVCNVVTESIDPGRRPVARGEEQEVEEEVYTVHPQLSQLLRTNFQTVVCGYQDQGAIRHLLPPTPPRIHAFVYECPPDEVERFTQSLAFIPLLLNPTAPHREEVIAACLRRASAAHQNPQEFLVAAGRELALLLSNQLPRLNPILRRLAL